MATISSLYIIGNGFDLHHGINSSYGNFREWLSENDCDLLYQFDKIYGDCDSDWWKDFENQLASLNAIEYSGGIAFENQPDLMSEHCDRTWNDAQIAVEQELEGLFCSLRQDFHNWIIQLNTPVYARKIKLEAKEALFVNFNYTLTLENLYNINPKHVLHIHGCVDYDEEFILGHGKSFDELQQLNSIELPKPPEDISSDELAQFYEDNAVGQELHEQLALDAAISGVAAQRKPVDTLLHRFADFIGTMDEVKNICIYGLSLSDVDVPYIQYLALKFKDAQWQFSDFKNQNLQKINSFCESNEITDYRVVNLEDIMQVHQLCIPFEEFE